jgi:serine protease Do
MKRFFSFVILVFLLLVAVDTLRKWHDRQPDMFGMSNPLGEIFGQGDGLHRRPEKYTLAEGPRVNPNDVDVLAAMSRQRITLAKAVVPSVVSVITSKTVQAPAYMNDPFFQFFHRGRVHGSQNGATEHALGSGVIVSKEGHIVTNNHVIDQMDDIEVELNDGRRKHATLIGADSGTDVAVLKIDSDNLTPLPFGDSDKVEVGETIMAVGNPYGYEESVTQGIISAKGRSGSDTLSDLFQIDAAINPGNSGGPLINVRGELIGLNEAIYSESGGWQGVGFAIPSATVRRTMDSILKTGRVIYGYLGVLDSPRTRALSELGAPADDHGALVYDVVVGSPADKASIQPGDLIQKFNNKEVHDFQDLRRDVSQVDVDATVPIELVRDGKTMNVKVRVSEKPSEGELAQVFRRQQQRSAGNAGGPAAGNTSAANGSGFATGLTVTELSPQVIRKLNLSADARGVLVTRVNSDSPAANVLQVGDIIEQIDQAPVESVADFARIVRDSPANEAVAVSIVRNRTRLLVAINPADDNHF